MGVDKCSEGGARDGALGNTLGADRGRAGVTKEAILPSGFSPGQVH